jgi:hypothetical protein
MAFSRVKDTHPMLSRYKDPEELVGYLRGPDRDLETKDQLLALLIRYLQSGQEAEIARVCLWLALWPGLDRTRRRNLSDFPGGADALVSQIAFIFSTNLNGLNLATVRRVAATLVANVERDVREAKKAQWEEDRETCPLEMEATAPVPSALIWKPHRDGLVSERFKAAELCVWLKPFFDRHTELVIASIGYDVTLAELAEALDVPYEAVKKRLQRALEKGVGECPRSAPDNRVFPDSGTAADGATR